MTIFEQAANIVDEPHRKSDGNIDENVIEWVNGSDTATVNFSQVKYQSKIRKMAEKFPDKVKIVSDKCVIVAHIPVKAIKLSIVERELTDEQRTALGERLRNSLKGDV